MIQISIRVVFRVHGCYQVSKHSIKLNFNKKTSSSRPGPYSKNQSKSRFLRGQQKITDDKFRQTRPLTQGRPIVQHDFGSEKFGKKTKSSSASSSSSSKSSGSTTDIVSETSTDSSKETFLAKDGTRLSTKFFRCPVSNANVSFFVWTT